MTVISIYSKAKVGRKAAVEGLQQRKDAGETVGRIHLLPALDATEIDNLFETAFPSADEMLRAA